MPYKIKRSHYADIYGPTTGDKVRLGDTSLMLEVEKRFHRLWRRMQIRRRQRSSAKAWARPPASAQDDALDCVITNALIVDYTGILQSRHRHQERSDRPASAKRAIPT